MRCWAGNFFYGAEAEMAIRAIKTADSEGIAEIAVTRSGVLRQLLFLGLL